MLLAEEFDQVSARLLPNDFCGRLNIVAVIEHLEKFSQGSVLSLGGKSHSSQLVGHCCFQTGDPFCGFGVHRLVCSHCGDEGFDLDFDRLGQFLWTLAQADLLALAIRVVELDTSRTVLILEDARHFSLSKNGQKPGYPLRSSQRQLPREPHSPPRGSSLGNCARITGLTVSGNLHRDVLISGSQAGQTTVSSLTSLLGSCQLPRRDCLISLWDFVARAIAARISSIV